ncbi:MAG TPA: hypothetical protein VGN11_02500 [Candidatus Baltobacteraceae bacterium]|jgi:hypothetical protein|nr:hypothetical protein [Candidatus Baltobacteraceae bacterium]
MGLLGSAATYFELLAHRKEPEAAQCVCDLFAGGYSLRSIYSDIFGAAVEEASRERACGRLSTEQETFVGDATERIMSIFAPMLFDMQYPLEHAVCASFGNGKICRTAGIAAALLMIDGYNVCNAGVGPAHDDLMCVIEELTPTLCVFCMNEANGMRPLARALQSISGISAMNNSFLIVVMPESEARVARVAGADICMQSVLGAVEAARTRLTAERRRNA